MSELNGIDFDYFSPKRTIIKRNKHIVIVFDDNKGRAFSRVDVIAMAKKLGIKPEDLK